VIFLIVNEALNSALYNISQSLLIPVLIILLIFFMYTLIQLGILIFEFYNRNRTQQDYNSINTLILSILAIDSPKEIITFIKESGLPFRQKNLLASLLKNSKMDPELRKSFARNFVESEDLYAVKKLEKTDIISKIAPAIGLMGTLIPLGPGLAALGAGDIQALSQQLIIAFGSAVIGMAAAAIGFTISKIRRRWYEGEISNLETITDIILEKLK
jgi:biopolymer transport protein ExbB/TolQ